MTRIIAVVSGKGGVGKTTVVSNLGAALSALGEKVLVIDGNVTGANLALHLGFNTLDPVSLNDVLAGRAYLPQAIYKHASGMAILPAALFDPEADLMGLKKYLHQVMGAKDYILIDAAAGVCDETRAAIEAADEVIIVTNPDVPSITHSMTSKAVAEALDRDVIGVVVNRRRGERQEVKDGDVERMMGVPVLMSVPEHRTVREATAKRMPVVAHSARSPATRALDSLARKVSGRPEKDGDGFLARIFGR